MTTLKPWREVITPNKEVLSGNVSMSDFAADLTMVAQGRATAQYQNPAYFYQRTFITEGTKTLLINVARRICGKGGEPVIQLQTGFGGGKTHTMLAVYHMVSNRDIPTRDLHGLSEILDLAGMRELATLPECRTVVIDGNNLAPAEQKIVDGIALKTLWGRMAWDLGGNAGYEFVRASDEAGTSPGKEVLIDLLQAFSPCVILIDELVAYFRQLPTDDDTPLPCGTFGTNLSFVQALTEAVKAVPNAIILASLPESVREAGSALGEQALERLAHVFGRVQTLWKPVDVEESFEIVRRRLFESNIDESARRNVCEAYQTLYRTNPEHFPTSTQGADYLDRLVRSYPIHPELFDQLYSHWTTLERFQKTRGVLKLMSNVIHALWDSDNHDLMIMPGSVPLADKETQLSITDPLQNGWSAVIDCDIDGVTSVAAQIDKKIPNLGKVRAATRVARTIFIGTAPKTSDIRQGIDQKRLLLGAVEPEQVADTFIQASRELSRDAHYFFSGEAGHVWFGITPNLSQEMRSRTEKYKTNEYVEEESRKILEQNLRGTLFPSVHIFTPHNDIPDDDTLRLVVLPINAAHSKDDSTATKKAKEILSLRGARPRINRNRLIFMACDVLCRESLKNQIATFLSWHSIVNDASSGRLNLDGNSLKEASQKIEECKRTLIRSVGEAFRYILIPELTMERLHFEDLTWNVIRLDVQSIMSIPDTLKSQLCDQEAVITQWAPVHLGKWLKNVFLRDGKHDISGIEIWEQMAHELYFPRLLDRKVLCSTLSNGAISGEFFGLAQGKDGEGKYIGLIFQDSSNVILDSSLLVLDPETAKKEKAIGSTGGGSTGGGSTGGGSTGGGSTGGGSTGGDGTGGGGTGGGGTRGGGTGGGEGRNHHFGCTVDLKTDAPRDEFFEIDNVLDVIKSKPGISLRITLEIHADAQSGFSEQQERVLKENLQTLGATCYFERES